MRPSLKVGFSFGLTSATITTLGLMVGLHSGTHSKLVVVGGILTIALADAFSDSLGIHVSQEFKGKSRKQVWESTLATLATKLVFTSTFVIPVVLLSLSLAIGVALVWGLLLLAVFSFLMARKQEVSPWRVVAEHLGIAILVIFVSHFLGDWLAIRFQ
jgi:VIT1/CCC1 family predicted Fe2+/Mn2+ transporter